MPARSAPPKPTPSRAWDSPRDGGRPGFRQARSLPYDAETQDLLWYYPITEQVELGAIAFTWLVYMAALLLLLGYTDAWWRRALVLVVFLGCAAFLLFVIRELGLPFHFNGIQSVS